MEMMQKVNKMSSDIKAKWVGALRSGGYAKALNRLALKGDPDRGIKPSYCALGVLTKLYCDNKEKDVFDFVKNNNTSLKDEVLDWAGLPLNDTEINVNYNGRCRVVSYLNDVQNLPFEKIADIIDENL